MERVTWVLRAAASTGKRLCAMCSNASRNSHDETRVVRSGDGSRISADTIANASRSSTQCRHAAAMSGTYMAQMCVHVCGRHGHSMWQTR